MRVNPLPVLNELKFGYVAVWRISNEVKVDGVDE